MADLSLERIKLIITITKRGTGTKIVDYFKSMKLHYDFICLGLGTANSEMLDYLGLEKTEKDIVITPAPISKIPIVLKGVTEKFSLKSPGMGIMFTVPITSVSSRVPQILCKPENMMTKGREIVLENNKKHELILAILNRGHTDTVMEAAKSAGATGGTIIHARRVGFEDAANLFGFTIQPEKEIIAILTPKEIKNDIMKKITAAAGINTECRAIVLSMQVDEIMGI